VLTSTTARRLGGRNAGEEVSEEAEVGCDGGGSVEMDGESEDATW